MAPVLLTATIITALLTAGGSILFGGQWWGYWPPHIWARIFCVLTLVKVKVVGRENIDSKTSYVFIANHQGAYDIFSIYGYLNHNFKWMMKQSLERIPLVGYACRCAGHIMVDRVNPTGIKQTIETAEKRLKNGTSLVVFPEGTRSTDGKIGQFKRGAFILAAEFHLPMVPITIDGSYNIMPKHRTIPHWGTITLTIHKPVDVEGKGSKELMNLTYETINSALVKK